MELSATLPINASTTTATQAAKKLFILTPPIYQNAETTLQRRDYFRCQVGLH